MGKGVTIIEQLVREKPLFRERDVRAKRVSPACLYDAEVFGTTLRTARRTQRPESVAFPESSTATRR